MHDCVEQLAKQMVSASLFLMLYFRVMYVRIPLILNGALIYGFIVVHTHTHTHIYKLYILLKIIS